jgi:3-methyladenine DNA glycosylase AlkD
MFTPESLRTDLIAFCEANADESIVKKYSRYFKEGGYDAYGVPYPMVQEKASAVLEEHGPDLPFVLNTCRLLIPGTKYEEASFALIMVKALKKQYTQETFDEIGHWFEIGIRNWAHTDSLCSEILSVFLLKKIVDYKALAGWRTAKNKFQRRAVPVVLIKLLKEHDDFREFFTFIEPLMMDPEREVHQGLGWFLREAWKKNHGQAEEFLLKYKDTAPRLIFQYATEKMPAAEKERFRRAKK